MELDVAQKIYLNKITHSVRASQAVLQYGVGAMVDFPDQTLMTAAPEYWEKQVTQIHDERLEKALHVDYFGMPRGKDDAKEGISYARFPEWYFCPKCRKFQPISAWIKEYDRKTNARVQADDPHMVKHMKCPVCYQDLVVARIVTVCENGHIDDFPWVKWVHCQNGGGKLRKKICEHPTLTFKTGASSTEGLEGLVVSCESCGARATLKSAFDPDIFQRLDKETQGEYDFSCTGRHPWKHYKEACGCYPKALQRGSSSVYFPITESSLVIPPYSSILTSKIENSSSFAKCKDSLRDMLQMPIPQEMKDMLIVEYISQYTKEISLEIGVSEEQVKPILERKWRGNEDEEYTTVSVKYRAEEYEALNGEISLALDYRDDFYREATNIADYNLPFLKNISLIQKIREVQALTGFSRIKPTDNSEPASQQGNRVSIKEPMTNWYPACEVRGEGIFIEFDVDEINKWRSENSVLQHRVDIINENYQKSFMGENNPRTVTSKYVLLHTISHLLIKQLSFECGYSIASLKERIYCSEPSEGKEMNGIFIYTASGDSEGTMGGLVRQGRPDTFPNIFKKAIESGMACSNDPVCSLSQGQGRDSLNLSACYSCTLIPETSCENFNIFLDRGMVVGTFNNKELGFYCKQLFEEEKWKCKTEVKQNDNRLSENIVLVPGTGTDVQDESYENIWKSISAWTDNENEHNLIEEILSKITLFSGKEKPLQNCTFMASNSTKEYKCELLWKKAKVMYFSGDNDDYEFAKLSDWKCFNGADSAVTADIIISAVKEK